MCGSYWSQWDKADLDSWQGIEPYQDDDHDDRECEDEEECTCLGCCSHNPCGNCMDCLGMSWRDFM